MKPLFFAWIHWDPSAIAIVLPIVNLPVTWYGLLFATGFWIGFHIFVKMFQDYLGLKESFVEGDIDWQAFSRASVIDLVGIERGSIESSNQFLKQMVLPKEAINDRKKEKLIERCRQERGETAAEQLKKRFTLEKTYPKIFLPLLVRARDFAEKLVLYIIIATVVGARLGHVFFYENLQDYLHTPFAIFKTWEGGLASHGGILAVIASLWLFHRSSRKIYPDYNWFMLLDAIAIPTMLVAGMIRIGNFFNQEILGTETAVPWAIVFGHPADGSSVVPRHPAQLYESIFYFGIFFSLLLLWKRFGNTWQPGRFAGIAIFSSFTFRFLIEFFKTGQSHWFDTPGSFLLMGQILSLPLAMIGGFLLFRKTGLKQIQ